MDGVNTMGLLKDKEKRPVLLKENQQALLFQYQKAKGILEYQSMIVKVNIFA